MNGFEWTSSRHDSPTFMLPASIADDVGGSTIAVHAVSYYSSGFFVSTQQIGNFTYSLSAGVLSIHVDGIADGQILSSPVIISFYGNFTARSVVCSWWDFANSTWSTEGCSLFSVSDVEAKCSCSHMTNFGILTSVLGGGSTSAVSAQDAFNLSIITYVGCSLSILGLIFTAATYIMFSAIRLPAKQILIHLCLTLITAQLIFLVGVDKTNQKLGCGVVTIMLHYALLSAFAWMLVEGIHLYKSFVYVFAGTSVNWILYLLIGYAAPFVIVLVTAAVRYGDYASGMYCWLPTTHGDIFAFVGPIAAVIIANVYVFIRIAYNIRAIEKRASKRQQVWLHFHTQTDLMCPIMIVFEHAW